MRLDLCKTRKTRLAGHRREPRPTPASSPSKQPDSAPPTPAPGLRPLPGTRRRACSLSAPPGRAARGAAKFLWREVRPTSRARERASGLRPRGEARARPSRRAANKSRARALRLQWLLPRTSQELPNVPLCFGSSAPPLTPEPAASQPVSEGGCLFSPFSCLSPPTVGPKCLPTSGSSPSCSALRPGLRGAWAGSQT